MALLIDTPTGGGKSPGERNIKMIFTKEQRREAEEMIEKCYEMLNKIYTMSNGKICVSVTAYADEPCVFIHDHRKQKSKTHLICTREEINGFFGRHKI